MQVVERLNTLPGRCCLLVTIPVDNTTPHAAPDLALTTDLPTDNAISLPPQLTGLPSNSIQPAPVSTRSWAVSDVRMPALTRAALLGTAHSAAGVGGADAAGAAPMEVDDTIAVDPADMGATKRHAGQSGQASRSGVQGGPQGAMAAVVDGVHQWLGAMSCGFRGAWCMTCVCAAAGTVRVCVRVFSRACAVRPRGENAFVCHVSAGPAVDAMLPPQLTSTEQELSDSVHIHEWTGLLHNRMVSKAPTHNTHAPMCRTVLVVCHGMTECAAFHTLLCVQGSERVLWWCVAVRRFSGPCCTLRSLCGSSAACGLQ